MGEINKVNTLLDSVNASSLLPTHIYLVDNLSKISQSDLIKTKATLSIYHPYKPYSVSINWNRFLHLYEDYIIISNDDIILRNDTIEVIIKDCEENKEELFITCPNSRWSFFVQRKKSISIVGEYDSNFKNAYFEDVDYEYRLKLAGYKTFYSKAKILEHRDSPSLNGTWRNKPNVIRNEKLYELKWGSKYVGHEKYQEPFNL